jgi:hypothetical protein
MTPATIVMERFHAKYIPEPNSGCWLWDGALTAGYGCMRVDKKTVYAHRISYEAHHGPVPAGMFVCHKCDVPACVNPAHLFVGTPAENSADMASKRRSPRGEKRHNSRLKAGDVDDIRKACAAGASQRSQALKYGVDQSTISLAVSGRTWQP